MSYKVNIQEALQLAFGESAGYAPVVGKDIGSKPEYSELSVIEQEEAVKRTAVGTPLIFPILFEGGNFKVYKEDGTLGEQSFADFTMPGATITDVSRAKNMVTKRVSGAKSTVKQIMGFDDWRIRMRGVMFPELGHQFPNPHDQKKQLHAWDNVVGKVRVVSQVLNDIGINYMTITFIRFRQIAGRPDMIPFEISALSDKNIEIDA